jgi:hypothetical protein
LEKKSLSRLARIALLAAMRSTGRTTLEPVAITLSGRDSQDKDMVSATSAAALASRALSSEEKWAQGFPSWMYGFSVVSAGSARQL